jgi:murein DD-endopeptidase MepM/ murein hydrolase activator NlpD
MQAMQTQAASTPLAPLVSSACPQGQPVCRQDGHFFLKRPIPAPGNFSVERTYRYGTDQSGLREPHHGVEFPNAQGTPVLAAADGTVIFAGDDKNVSLSWVPAFYGKVVVIRHQFSGIAQPVFTLYAHLYQIEVETGQQVRVGQQIGQVGATGTAIGSHLHFEVRQGNNDYRSNRNPELWLQPVAGTGVLAGRLEDGRGQPAKGRVNLQRIEHGQLNPVSLTVLETYVTNELQPVKADDDWHENFAVGELPQGEYRLSLVYNSSILEQTVFIEPGRLTFVLFTLK